MYKPSPSHQQFLNIITEKNRNNRVNLDVGGMAYSVLGKKIDLPLIKAQYVGPQQNKTSVEGGFKKLEKWMSDPTPAKWVKLFGKNNAFGLQLRNYLLNRNDLGDVKGMPTANKVFDALNVKKLLTPGQINKINELTTGGKGKNLRSIGSRTFGNLKYSMDDVIETIKNFQNGEQWLRRNPDPNKIGPDGKNIYRKYANAIKGMQREQSRIGGFPFGDNSEKKLWSNLYRASYRGDRIKIVGEFADGNLPINEDGKIDWKMKDKNGVAAWKRVQFEDLEAPKKKIFKWGGDFKRGDFKKQIDNVFGEGFFDKSTAAYDVQVRTGSKRDFTKEGGGRTIKNDLKIALLRNEALLENPKATKKEINDFINNKARRFNITEVHHPDGVGVNPYKTEPTFRYANRALDKEVMQPLKAGTIDINEAKLRIDRINKNVGPIRVKLDDGYYGNYVNTQKSIIEAAKKFPLRNLRKIPDIKLASEIEQPEKSKTRDMYKNAFKDSEGFISTDLLKDVGKGAGKLLTAAGTPLGVLGITAGFGIDPTSAVDRVALGAEAALAPSLVKGTSQLTKNALLQKLFNLGLSPRAAMRVARIASPLGIASLGGEALYQYGKFVKDELERIENMTPEEREAYNADQEEQMGMSAANGGLITREAFKDGFDPKKRQTMKILGGLASIPVLGKYIKILGPLAPKVVETVERSADAIPNFIYDLIAKIKADGPKFFTGNRADEFEYVYRKDGYEVREQGNKITVRKSDDPDNPYYKEMEMELELDPETGGVTYKEATARPDGDGKLKDIEESIDDVDLQEMEKYTYDE